MQAGQSIHREKTISGRYLDVSQLDNAVFLITVMDSHASGQAVRSLDGRMVHRNIRYDRC
jgi:crotonobetainyl-CoA:carnitine CoA-transferase CaiB-like acyl-CoA transferase